MTDAPADLPSDLEYVSDLMPGIRRRRTRSGFRYVDCAGKPLGDGEEVRRIRRLAIPPAWSDVWISPIANGHLQASGRDARGRKQYRYHSRWREVRDRSKYERTLDFARALPALRARVEQDLGRPGLPRDKVLATIVRLLELTLIRVGNEEYALTNGSFGLTTLRKRHIHLEGPKLRFEFKGKSGKKHIIGVNDRRISRIVRRIEEIRGQPLFQYIDEDGERRQVSSGDVNAYIREATGGDFTAKDFRTWAGTVLAATALNAIDGEQECATKKDLVRVVEEVARQLGNTPAVCRNCYIHPLIIDSYLGGELRPALARELKKAARKATGGLRPEEAAVFALMRSLEKQAERLSA